MIINWENVLKHLSLLLNVKLNFEEHIYERIKKPSKGIIVIKKSHYFLQCVSLLTFYKSFVWPHMDYGDVVYDQPNDPTLSDKIESVQYNAWLTITSTIMGTSWKKLY